MKKNKRIRVRSRQKAGVGMKPGVGKVEYVTEMAFAEPELLEAYERLTQRVINLTERVEQCEGVVRSTSAGNPVAPEVAGIELADYIRKQWAFFGDKVAGTDAADVLEMCWERDFWRAKSLGTELP